MPARRQKTRTKRVSFRKIAQTTLKDPRFLNALIKDPERALTARKWSLSSKQMRKVKSSLKRKYKVKGGRLLTMMVRYKSLSGPIWPI